MNKKQEKEPLHPFLTKHAPSQISNTQKLCYRHRSDLVKNRGPDEFDFEKVQHVSSITS
jgi:F-box/WD-40 domain protein MET30